MIAWLLAAAAWAACTGPATTELVRYTKEQSIDLAIVFSPSGDGHGADLARALLDHGRCAVLVLRE